MNKRDLIEALSLLNDEDEVYVAYIGHDDNVNFLSPDVLSNGSEAVLVLPFDRISFDNPDYVDCRELL